MKDRVSKYPGRALITPEDGSTPFYATITRADEPTQAGDPMGKVTFLRDETAALFGLDEAAVPDDVWRAIVAAAFAMTGQLNVENTDEYIGVQKTRKINDILYHTGLGLGTNATYGASASLCLTNDAGSVLGRIDAWANGNLTHKNANTNYLPIGRLEIGSYTGTGQNGASNPNKLNFSFVPKVVLITNSGATNFTWGMWVSGGTTLGGTSNAPATLSDKTLSWYSVANAGGQYNVSGTKYVYIAIG